MAETFNMQKWLEEQKALYATKAQEAKNSSNIREFVPGKYFVRFTGWEMTQAKSSGRPQEHLTFVIAAGDQVGARGDRYNGLGNEDSFQYLSRDIMRFGEDPTAYDITQLPDLLKSLGAQKRYGWITIKEKQGEYPQRIYIDRVESAGFDPSTVELPDETATNLLDAPVGGGDETPAAEMAGSDPDLATMADSSASENAGEPADGEEVQIGMKVKFKRGDQDLEGEITGIDNEAMEVKVKAGQRTYTVAADEPSLKLAE